MLCACKSRMARTRVGSDVAHCMQAGFRPLFERKASGRPTAGSLPPFLPSCPPGPSISQPMSGSRQFYPVRPFPTAHPPPPPPACPIPARKPTNLCRVQTTGDGPIHRCVDRRRRYQRRRHQPPLGREDAPADTEHSRRDRVHRPTCLVHRHFPRPLHHHPHRGYARPLLRPRAFARGHRARGCPAPSVRVPQETGGRSARCACGGDPCHRPCRRELRCQDGREHNNVPT